MSLLFRNKSADHRIGFRSIPDDEEWDLCYTISWSMPIKRGRLVDWSARSHITDLKGAKRFAKKWGLRLPEDPRLKKQRTRLVTILNNIYQ